MKFSIWRKNQDGSMSESEFDYDPPTEGGYEMPMAHCDQKILHAPGKCQFCDHYPQAQELREWWGINFTGENDPGKSPCPSEHSRSGELRDRWPGNTPEGWTAR